MDNFSDFIRDSHPGTVTGVANSAEPWINKWLNNAAEWDEWGRGESVADVACKMSNYGIATGSVQAYASREGYAKDYVGMHENAEWFAFIFHVEDMKGKLRVPFDVVLIGRPFWLRSKQFKVLTADERVGAEIPARISWEKSYAEFWRRALQLKSDSAGWPVGLYRFLLTLQKIRPDL
jgi:hypothetical protein